MRIRSAQSTDADAIARIYNPYILNTIVTFEEMPVDANTMAARIEETAAAGLPWLVADIDGEVVGYAYASRWRTRSAYRHSVESTVYLATDRVRSGIGSRLYAQLLNDLTRAGMHAVVGGISLPNEASVAFHEAHGFVKVAHFSEIGFKLNRWIDVGYWQRPLP